MKIKVFLAVLAGILLAACAEDVIENNIVMKSRHSLTVKVTDEFAATTRANYSGFPSTTFETGDAIGVYAFDGSSYAVSNIRFVRQSDGSWLPDEEIPYNEDCTYYAYFPYRATTYTPSTSGTVDAIDTKFASFIADASDYFWQADQSTKAGFTYSNLMISKGVITDTDDDEVTVNFTMKHKRALAVLGDVVNKWYYTDATGTKYTPTVIFSSGNKPYEIDGVYYFLTKPNVATTVAGNSINLSAGKYDEFVIELTGTPEYQYSLSVDNGGSFGSFNSSKPSWLTLTKSGKDFEITTTNSTSDYVYLGTGNRRYVAADATLKAAAPVSDVDLSMVDNAGNTRVSRTTANCYLVHAAGTYKIPLVYGNAIKNGSTNADAYYTYQTSGVLQRFVNHADTGITDPWLKNNSVTPDGAELIWEDLQGLISSVGISGDYLTFTVSESNIAEGNAVIAATVSGTVVWSWHIWVTTETLSSNRLTSIDTGNHTNLTGVSAPYKVAPVNIGQVSGTIITDATIYAAEQCKVSATANGITVEFLVTAKDNAKYGTNYYNPCPYYQWGRKDAERPYTGAYNASGIYALNPTSVYDAYSIGITIQNPDSHYYNSSNQGPYDEEMFNYWDMNQTGGGNTTSATVKTVYDPCPPDFCVPTGNLYYYADSDSENMSWQSTPDGANWTINGTTIFFPAVGRRSALGGSAPRYTDYGFYWGASVYSYTYSYMLFLSDGRFSWTYNPRADGYPVRPVAEE